MSRQITFGLILILAIGCKSNENNEFTKEIDSLQTTEIKKAEPIESEIKKDDTKKRQYILPIHGELNQQNLNKYYPKVTDTIEDLRIIGSEKIDLNLGNNIIVSLLHNTGTFDQMIICTHNKDFNLIDNLYIGKATDFDNGKSHTIEYNIKDKNKIIFTQTDWAYVGEEIQPVKIENMSITINENGQIKHMKTMPNSVYKK
ncbi:hypothetical protein ACFO3U_13090 [Flavobacterium ponti]|uniref:Lipoprotein n=1 Tax=Flavobacterium ponti TaxID=665133 RepID=A0ABV9P6V0_9FLAO